MRIVSCARAILLDNLNDPLAMPYNYALDSSTDSELLSDLGDNLIRELANHGRPMRLVSRDQANISRLR